MLTMCTSTFVSTELSTYSIKNESECITLCLTVVYFSKCKWAETRGKELNSEQHLFKRKIFHSKRSESMNYSLKKVMILLFFAITKWVITHFRVFYHSKSFYPAYNSWKEFERYIREENGHDKMNIYDQTLATWKHLLYHTILYRFFYTFIVAWSLTSLNWSQILQNVKSFIGKIFLVNHKPPSLSVHDYILHFPSLDHIS